MPKRDRRVSMTPTWAARVAPEAAPVDWKDKGTAGLVLRVEVSGRKTWICRYTFAGKDRRYRLGTFPATSLATARKAARKAVGLVEDGRDPQAAKAKNRLGGTLATALDSWLGDEKLGPAGKWKGGLEGGTARSFLPHVRAFKEQLGELRLPELAPQACERFVIEPKAPATRNRRLTALRLFMKWAKRKGLIESDPTAQLGKEHERERDRVLSDAELRALIHGFDSTRYGRAVRLLAFTGLRRDEALSAQWKWLDSEAGVLTIPKATEKTGKARSGDVRRVALSPQAVALLAEQRKAQLAEGSRSPFVFATKTGERPHADCLKPHLYRLKGKRANGLAASTDKRAKPRPALLPEDVTIHDVRRTVAHALAHLHERDSGEPISPLVIDHDVLGHVRPKLLRTYMPTVPLGPARDALTRWAVVLDGILTAKATAAKTEGR